MSVVSPLEADISLSDGPGAVAGMFKLRGQALTIVRPRAEDGASAGAYRVQLGKNDPVFAALAGLPEKISGPTPVPDMPVVTVSVRDKGKTRSLVAGRPSSDEHVAKLLAELSRLEKAALANSALTLSIDVQSPPTTAKAAARTEISVHVYVKGDKGAEAQFDPRAIVVESTPVPKPATPGTTPLPPEWDEVGRPLAKSAVHIVKTGDTSTFGVLQKGLDPGPRLIRTVLRGTVTLRSSDGAQEIPMDLSSKPIRIGDQAAGPRE
jgi:hypothetical protein